MASVIACTDPNSKSPTVTRGERAGQHRQEGQRRGPERAEQHQEKRDHAQGGQHRDALQVAAHPPLGIERDGGHAGAPQREGAARQPVGVVEGASDLVEQRRLGRRVERRMAQA